MTDNQRMWTVYELMGKLIDDAEREISEARRFRGQIIDAITNGDLDRVADRADMTAIRFRSLARTNEQIEGLVRALMTDAHGGTATATETGTGTDDETDE